MCATITTSGVYKIYINDIFDHTFNASDKVSYISATRAHRSLNGYIDYYKLWSKALILEKWGMYVYNKIIFKLYYVYYIIWHLIQRREIQELI